MERYLVLCKLSSCDGDFTPPFVRFSNFSSVVDYIENLDEQYQVKEISIKFSPYFFDNND